MAAAYFWTTLALSWLDPLETAAARFALGAAVLLIVTRHHQPLRMLRDHYGVYTGLGAVSIAAFAVTNAAALDRSLPVTVSVMMAFTPIMTPSPQPGSSASG